MNKLLIIITCLIATSFAGKDCSSCKKETSKKEPAEIKIQKDLTKFYDNINKLKKDGKNDEAKKLLKEKIAQLKKDGSTKHANLMQGLLNTLIKEERIVNLPIKHNLRLDSYRKETPKKEQNKDTTEPEKRNKK